MTIAKQYVKYHGISVPEIQGAKGGKGGGTVSPNSLFSSDFLFLTTAIGEGPVYRINSNGPQDIQIQDSSIDDLLKLDGDGSINTDNFAVGYATGTITQAPIPVFGDQIITPQGFASPVTLRNGPPEGASNTDYAPESSITEQQTSAFAWDAIRFLFSIDQLAKTDDKGNVSAYSAELSIDIFKSDGFTPVTAEPIKIVITGKTDKPVRRTYEYQIGKNKQDDNGYKFTIKKTSQDSADSKIQDSISVVGWFEIENKPQAYPRTAIIGYGLKAVNEHTGGIPTFTSMVKGLLVKVPSNYNQPVLSRLAIDNTDPVAYYERANEIDWRELELPQTGRISINGTKTTIGYTQQGYSLQRPGPSTTLTAANPQIYVGTWDGTFVYSWSQNPVWIIYDLLTNTTYGLGIPPENIDKYKFYQVAQYCDACDPNTGRFVGVTGVADGSYRYKPRGLYNTVRDNQRGLPEGTTIRERRFITDVTISEQEKSMDLLNKIAATFRGMLIYSASKITLAVDMPDEYPVMMFNEATMKQGSFQLSGSKESDVYTGIDVSYVDPTNHFKRETVRVDTADANDGSDTSDIENIATLDLFGVTRRSQAIRMAQYQIAASRYQRRNISFTASTDAINLAPGDVISIASRSSGVAYGYGGKVSLSSDRNLIGYSEDFSVAGWAKLQSTITSNTVTAPDGTLTADTITASTIDPYITYNVASTSRTHTFSVWLRGSGTTIGKQPSLYIGRDTFFAEYFHSGYLPALTSSWQRYTFTATFATTPASVTARIDAPDYLAAAGDIVYVWGAQLEVGSVATSYIKTPATAVALEHFTFPALTSSVFTANTYPLSLRILSQDSDRLETYIISNSVFSTSTSANVSFGIDLATVNVVSRFNKYSKRYENISTTGFTANVVPKAGDLWSLGEIENPLNYYTDKSSKLFKVTNTKRESSEEIAISAIEYISNVYIDSDTFINYQPTAYIDTQSAFATPPAPRFKLTAVPRTKLDGTVVVDGVLKTNTQKDGYSQKFETEYYVSSPIATSLIANVTSTSPLTLKVANAAALALNTNAPSSMLTGKNGFSTAIGKVTLLCNTVTTSTGSIQLTVEGLSSCLDVNYNTHILNVTSSLPGITNKVIIPIKAQSTSTAGRNFVGYVNPYIEISKDVAYSTGTNILTILDDSNSIRNLLPEAPFYISLNQAVNSGAYANNNFYVEGTSYTYIDTGLLARGETNYIDLDIKPRHSNFVRLYVDGIEKSTSGIVNYNKTVNRPANIAITAGSSDTTYRIEVDHLTVPTIEVGDSLEVSAGNVFVVANTSYDPASAKYSAALTSNNIYRLDLVTSPSFNLSGYRFINTSPNPVGTIKNVSGSSFILDYNTTTYPGNFRLANTNVYSIEIDSSFSRYFLSEDGKIPELKLGTTSIKARNKNTIGRYSPYVQSSIFVTALPIQKVEFLELVEAIYIEQTGGATIRGIVSFNAIQNQQVTDYEISYKISSSKSIISADLQAYNTVKVSAQAIDSDGKIRYTINNIDRGKAAGDNSITVVVTPLNRAIRGVSSEITQSITGKTTPPANIEKLTAGQQGELVVVVWEYKTNDDNQFVDLDLAQVEIRRLSGTIDINLSNFLRADKLVKVSPPTSNKSIPIDNYGTYTYLVRTKDTSGNESDSIVGYTLTTTKAQSYSTVAAYNEDEPSITFTDIPNSNLGQANYASFATSVNSGLTGVNTNKVDNANGSSSGWSAIPGFVTDLKAAGNAVYYTQIRDFGQAVTGYVTLDVTSTQEIQSTYGDQYRSVVNSVTDISPLANVLIDDTNGGIGYYLNNSSRRGAYDTTNKTWAETTTGNNVWAIWNRGINTSDVANANTYALIAGVINANAIALGATYYANGIATGSNSLANLTTRSSSYTLVDLKQYSDYGSATYEGEPNIIAAQTFIRTSLSNVYYSANGNVNTLAFSSSGDGFLPYTAGKRTFRYLQLKYVITNSDINNYDFTLDKFRYAVEKEETKYTNTFIYSSSNMTIDYSASKFLYRPAIQITTQTISNGTTNLVSAIFTAISNTSVSLSLARTNGTGYYPADGTATIMLTATGV